MKYKTIFFINTSNNYKIRFSQGNFTYRDLLKECLLSLLETDFTYGRESHEGCYNCLQVMHSQTNRVLNFIGNLYHTPYLGRDKIKLAKKLKPYLNKPVTIQYTPRLGVETKKINDILESFTIGPQALFTSGMLRQFNVITFRLKNTGKITLVDGDTNDLNFISITAASGLVHSVRPL